MSSNNGHGAQGYTILWLPEALTQLREWGELAVKLQLRKEYAAALRRMKTLLLTQPVSFGDFLWSYKNIRAVERRGLIANWFFVWYGVDPSARQIVVRSMIPAPGSPLSNSQ